MLKLKELKVENFKSLIKTNISEFGDINMFYGFNNSGKSNVFKFLHLLFSKKLKIEKIQVKEDTYKKSSIENKLIDKVDFWNATLYNMPFIFTNNDRKKKITFEVKFDIENIKLPKIKLLSQNGFIDKKKTSTEIKFVGEITEKNSKNSLLIVKKGILNNEEFYEFDDGISFGFKNKNIDGLDLILAEEIMRIFNDCIEFIDTDRNLDIEIFDNGIDFNLDNKNFKNWLFELNMNAEKNEIFNNLIEFLGEFEFSSDAISKLGGNAESFPFKKFTSIGFTRFENEIEIMLKNEKIRLPLSSFGTGIQQFFYILTRIFMNKSRIVIIEELELNLSPLYQIEIMKFLRKKMLDKNFDQLLFSSHSPLFTLKGSNLVDIVQHVQINNRADEGTDVESHNEWNYDDNISYFSMLFS